MKVFLQSQARSRSSMMMRILEMGGVPCEYDTGTQLEKLMKGKYRNPHGFFEMQNPSYEKCIKSLGTRELVKIPKDVKVIYLVRDFEQVVKSLQAMNPQWNQREALARMRNDIERELIGRPVLKIQSEDVLADPRKECERIKEFLKDDYDFNVDEAIKAIDNSLTVVR